MQPHAVVDVLDAAEQLVGQADDEWDRQALPAGDFHLFFVVRQSCTSIVPLEPQSILIVQKSGQVAAFLPPEAYDDAAAALDSEHIL